MGFSLSDLDPSKAVKKVARATGIEAAIDVFSLGALDSLSGGELGAEASLESFKKNVLGDIGADDGIAQAQFELLAAERSVRREQDTKERRRQIRQATVAQANVTATNLATGGSGDSSGAQVAGDEIQNQLGFNLGEINTATAGVNLLNIKKTAVNQAITSAADSRNQASNLFAIGGAVVGGIFGGPGGAAAGASLGGQVGNAIG